MPYVVTTIVVDAPAALVYELAKEQERFPQFMPDVESVTVVERHADRVLTQWKTLIEDAPIEWLEEDRFDDAGLRIDYKLLEGDLDDLKSSFRRVRATFAQPPAAPLAVNGVTNVVQEGRTVSMLVHGGVDNVVAHVRSLEASAVNVDTVTLKDIFLDLVRPQ